MVISKTRSRCLKTILLLIVFILYPFGGFIIAMIFLSYRQLKYISSGIVIIFAGLYGYTYLPHEDADIIRHYQTFISISSLHSLSDLFSYLGLNFRPDFGIELIYWIITRFSTNHQLVGFLGSSLYYGFLLGIILNWLQICPQKNYNRSFWLLSLSLLALITPTEFNGMRQSTANAILLYIMSSKKIWKISFYKQLLLLIIPCLIHFSMIPFALIGIVSFHWNYHRCYSFSIIISILGIALLPILNTLIKVLSHVGYVGFAISLKIMEYTSASDLSMYMGTRIRYYIILILLIFSPILIRKIKNICKNVADKSLSFLKFSMLTFGYSIFSIQTYIFARNLLIFKIISLLLLTYISISPLIKYNIRKYALYSLLFVTLSGPIMLLREYQTLNLSLFTSSLYSILNISTRIEGYHYDFSSFM